MIAPTMETAMHIATAPRPAPAPAPRSTLRWNLACHAGLFWAAMTALGFHFIRWGMIAIPGRTLLTLLACTVAAAMIGGTLWWFWLRPTLRRHNAPHAAFLAGVLTGATAFHAFSTTWLLMLQDKPLGLGTLLAAASSFACLEPQVLSLLAYFLFTWGLLAMALRRFQSSSAMRGGL